VADTENHAIRRLTLVQSRRGPVCIRVSTICGSGKAGFADGSDAGAAMFNRPCSVCTDNSGNIYVGDLMNDKIRIIRTRHDPEAAAAGDFLEISSISKDFCPLSVRFDPSDNCLICIDFSGDKLRRVNLGTTTGEELLVVDGRDGRSTVRFQMLLGICSAGPGKFFVSDGNQIYELSRRTSGAYHARVVAGNGATSGLANGIGIDSRFNGLEGLCLDHEGNLFGTDCDNHLIRTISIPLLLLKHLPGDKKS